MRWRHPNIDDDDLGLVLTHELEELARIAGLTDDLEVRPLEQAREPLAQKDVIVGHNDPPLVVLRRLDDLQPYAVQPRPPTR